MDFGFLTKYYGMYLTGARNTLLLAFFTVLLGVFFGVALALMRLSKNPILKGFAASYIEFIRGTPLLVQLLIIYYGLPHLTGMRFPDLFAGIVALTFNSAAYIAEIIRAGIMSVDKGQMEAARSLGMPHSMAMKHIIIPQAFKNILPALGNEFIVVIKESAIVSIIGISDIMRTATIVRGNTYRPFEPLIVAAVMYFMITFTLSNLMRMMERRLRASD
ncbi:polar amino acid ABC transporter, inner membrane subunit [Alkaliphilus metalliredigens QYMF]|uniref:Polar amino acid ABC transporter, inner membrane subunit n=1 Tax=Alkaliphilus metalliredigens (strain QYMF) TaxID=293826 RepID=A6TNT3_ALKMQ|nr:amino acid ABC transporter permease [Alkaliphilus metalliredigens]ABR47851.1 polar amino acid ABC transporter, inner membrane subunit [Alkaliphilus metalliredigens QYMF]